MDENDLFTFYFNLGLEKKDILKNLKDDGLAITERTLKRRLSSLNLYRRKNYTGMEDVAEFIQKEVKTSGVLHGYKWLWLKMIQKGFVVKQETVRMGVQVVDPEGVAARRKGKLKRREYYSQGANFTWHLDGYDKLKPYGICISGAIDGFSRYIIWLKAGRTNNNPDVIGGYYIEAVADLGFCPKTVRGDCGTENVLVKELQTYLRNENSEVPSSRPPYLSGKSVANQRIESWWNILRKHASQFWMDFFKDLSDHGYFDGSSIHKAVIQCVFMDVIQAELNEVVLQWNCHRIRKNKNALSPAGKPINMFRFSEDYGKEQCGIIVKERDLVELVPQCTFLDSSCKDDMKNLCEFILNKHNIPWPSNDVGALKEVYKFLIQQIKEVI